MSKHVLPIDLATPPLPTTSARRAALAMAFSGLLLGGCSVGPDYLRRFP